jgi:hypothetical protein
VHKHFCQATVKNSISPLHLPNPSAYSLLAHHLSQSNSVKASLKPNNAVHYTPHHSLCQPALARFCGSSELLLRHQLSKLYRGDLPRCFPDCRVCPSFSVTFYVLICTISSYHFAHLLSLTNLPRYRILEVLPAHTQRFGSMETRKLAPTLAAR